MLIINGMKYAKNVAEFNDTLFAGGKTADGFYKKMRNGVKLFNLQNELFAFIVDNKFGEVFAVSARVTDGQSHYFYSTTDADKKTLCPPEFIGIGGFVDYLKDCLKVAGLKREL